METLGTIGRRELLAILAVGALASPISGVAQKSRLHRVGVLNVTSSSDAGWRQRFETFRTTLRELGYIEGKNVSYEIRAADSRAERLPSLAQELVGLNVEVIVTDGGEPAIYAARDATRAIPVVFVSAIDPVGQGFVASLARPGGNITGMATQSPEVIAKRLELLLETVPSAKRVTYLSADSPGRQTVTANIEALSELAKKIGIEIHAIGAGTSGDFNPAFAQMAQKKIDAVIVSPTTRLTPHAPLLARLALESKLPSVCEHTVYVENGALLSFGANRLEMVRRAANMVDKILKGAKSSEIPVEQPTHFELIVNMKTAKALGLKIPPTVLARADRLIE